MEDWIQISPEDDIEKNICKTISIEIVDLHNEWWDEEAEYKITRDILIALMQASVNIGVGAVLKLTRCSRYKNDIFITKIFKNIELFIKLYLKKQGLFSDFIAIQGEHIKLLQNKFQPILTWNFDITSDGQISFNVLPIKNEMPIEMDLL